MVKAVPPLLVAILPETFGSPMEDFIRLIMSTTQIVPTQIVPIIVEVSGFRS